MCWRRHREVGSSAHGHARLGDVALGPSGGCPWITGMKETLTDVYCGLTAP